MPDRILVYDLLFATRGDVHTGVERFAINAFNASRASGTESWAIAHETTHLTSTENLVRMGSPLKAWASLGQILKQQFGSNYAKRIAVICPAFPISPSLVPTKVPVSRVIHDDFAWTRTASLSLKGKAIFKHYESLVIRRNNFLFAPTTIARDGVAAATGRQDVMVCGNAPGMAEGVVDQMPDLTAAPGTFILLVGTIEPRKNYERLIQLAHHAAAKSLRFVVVGRPGWGETTKAFQSGLPENIQWLENATDDQLQWLYKNCASFLTLSHAEGFNMPLVEAGMNNCAIAYSDIPIHRDVAPSSATALDLSMDDERLLGTLVHRRPEISPSGRDAYRAKYSWKAVATALETPLRTFD